MSWNVAGIRACIRKNAFDFLKNENIDILCIQETKAEEHQVKLPIWIEEMYPYRAWNSSKGTTQRKGFSGTCIWSKKEPISRIETPSFDEEGRIVALEYSKFIIVTVYTPNSQCLESERLKYRTEYWQSHYEEFILNLQQVKPVIMCGDFNVAHKDIDLHDAEKHKNVSAGCLNIERNQFQNFIDNDFVDTFRKFNTNTGQYTYWELRIPVFRKRNIGWRIDYFLAHKKIMKYVRNATIRPEIIGSDHCPITCELEFSPKKLIL